MLLLFWGIAGVQYYMFHVYGIVIYIFKSYNPNVIYWFVISDILIQHFFPFFSFYFSFFFFLFLSLVKFQRNHLDLFFFWLHLRYMEVPRLGVKSELQSTSQPQQCEIQATSVTHATACSNARFFLNPLSKTRDQTHILMDISQIFNKLSHNGNSLIQHF